MRKLSSGALASLCLAMVLCASVAAGQDISNVPGNVADATQGEALESIAGFSGSVRLEKKGILKVSETILYDFGNQERHGIFRDIPLKYDAGRNVLDIYDVSVTDANGTSYPFETSRNGKYLNIKIGDPDVLVSGLKTYIISYAVEGAVQWGQDADTLAWNVTGDGWTVPIRRASATLLLPSAGDTAQITFACYQGIYGSTEACEIQATPSSSMSVNFATARPLEAWEGFTIAATFPKGFLTPPTPTERLQEFVLRYLVFLLPLGVFAFLFRHWWRQGRDPKGRGTIIPQYEPPDSLLPIEIGTLSKGRVKPDHISAEIISLAVRGFLKITPFGEGRGKPDDYKLEKLKDATEAEPLFDRLLMAGLFAATFPGMTLAGIRKAMKQAKALKNTKDPEAAMPLLQELFGTQQDVMLSSLKNKFHSFLEKIKESVFLSLIDRGYYAKDPRKTTGVYLLIAIAVVMGGIFLLQSWPAGLLAVVGSGILIGVFGIIMPKVTPKGALEKESIQGFKEYLNIAEKDRLNFHNAPEKTPEIFEAFLPYALALGVVDAWAKEFQGIYTEPPKWYGGSYANGFLVGSLAHDLQGFNTFAGKSVGASASGGGGAGGGFSGGGAGGGGGGSW